MIALLFTVAVATTPVQALGQAQVVAGNRVVARDKALAAALEQAVDQALAYVLEPDARVRAQAALRAQLLPRARSYVPTYRVLDEHEIEGDKFQVQIEAQVDTTLLRRDAVAIAGSGGSTTTKTPPQAGKPRVLIALNGPPAAAARRALEQRGFPEAAAPETRPPTSDAEAAQRAKSAGAGLVLVGTAESRSDGKIRGTDQEAAQARVELRMLDADARALARGASDARGFAAAGANAAEQALEQAGAQAAEQLGNELMQRFATSGASSDPGGVLIRVQGLPSMRDMEALQQTLSQQAGVTSVLPRRLGGGEVWLTIRGRATGGGLAQTLRAQGLQVDVATEREIRVRVPRGTQ